MEKRHWESLSVGHDKDTREYIVFITERVQSLSLCQTVVSWKRRHRNAGASPRYLGGPQLPSFVSQSNRSHHREHTDALPMAAPVPSMGALRALRHSIQPRVRSTTHVRHATLLKRPKRPYTFTQLITLSDGSSFTLRTTNPQPVYKSAKDIRNAPLWNPSSQKLLNVEEDEAGRLAAFRAKFGRGWDTDAEKVRCDD